MARLDQLARLYEARAQKARAAQTLVAQLRELIGGDVALSREIVRALIEGNTVAAEPKAEAKAPTLHGAEKPSHFQKIKAFFEANGNRWATIDEISRAIDVRRNAFVGVMYSFHKSKFEQRKHPTAPRARQWRLRQAGENDGLLPKGGPNEQN